MDIRLDVTPRESLDRVMSFKDYAAIGFGWVVGVGWVVYAGQWILNGGALGAVLGFVIGGLLLIPLGKCYAELTAAIPVSGGEVAFTYKAFGPLVAFLTAWVLSLKYVALTPFETIAVGALMEEIFPSLVTAPLYEISGYSISSLGLISGVMTGLWVAWINWRGAKEMAQFQKIVVAGLILCTFAFCAVLFLNGDIKNFQPLFAGDGKWWALAPASIISVIVVVPFFLAGFDGIPQAAEESGTKMQPRELGVAIVATIAIGIAFYVLIILALGYGISSSELNEIASKKAQLPVAEVFRSSLGFEWGAKLVLGAALLGLISTLNAVFMAGTRLLFAQGRGGLLPHWFAELHPTHNTPKNAIIFVGLFAVLGPIVGKAGLIHIVNANSLIFSSVLLVAALSTLRLRKTAKDLVRPYRIKTSTLWFAVASGAALVGLMTVPGSPGQTSGATVVLVIGWMIVGSALYYHRRSKKDMSNEEQSYMILGENNQSG